MARVIQRISITMPSLSQRFKTLTLGSFPKSVSCCCSRSEDYDSSRILPSVVGEGAVPRNDTSTSGGEMNSTIEGRLIYLNGRATSLDNKTLAFAPSLALFCGKAEPGVVVKETAGGVKHGKPIERTYDTPKSNNLFRLPYKMPSIINPRMIIDYRIPTANPVNEVIDPSSSDNKTIEEAPDNNNSNVEKQAARLIVIRRSKMNKHKLKKLRKKMKYVWDRVKQRRETRKEKAFLNSLMAQIKEAEKFDAKAYVTEIIRKAKEKPPVVMYWKRSKLPDYLVKEKLAEKARQEQQEYLSILDKRDQKKLA